MNTVTHDLVRLPERVAINRYLAWRKYRTRERDGKKNLVTFVEWLQQSQIQILPPEWPENAGQRSLPPDVSNGVHAGRRRGDATDFRAAVVKR